jgi:tRNA (guanosine-2'-O-)-methyltransferase
MKQLRGTDLKRFNRAYRRAHPPQHDIVLLLQNVEYATNVGSIFRIAEGCRVAEMILSGITPTPPHPRISKVARGKVRRVPWQHVERPDQAVDALKGNGYRICAVELTDNAVPYYEYNYPEKICLVVGHEEHGIPGHTLDLCDDAVFIPMYGKGLSLNVHVALAIACYHIRYREVV